MCKMVPVSKPSLCQHAREWDAITLQHFVEQNAWTQGNVKKIKEEVAKIYLIDHSKMKMKLEIKLLIDRRIKYSHELFDFDNGFDGKQEN